MSRKFISLVLAASVAVAGVTASQAQADKRTRNLVLGIATLGIIGAAIADSKKDSRARVSTHNDTRRDRYGHYHGETYHSHDYDYRRPHSHTRTYDRDRTRDRTRDRDRDRDRYVRRPHHDVTPRPLPGRVFMSELPRRCLVTVENRRGSHKFYEKRCIERNYRHARALPESCEIRVRAGGRKLRGYSPSCLREHNRQRNARALNRH